MRASHVSVAQGSGHLVVSSGKMFAGLSEYVLNKTYPDDPVFFCTFPTAPPLLPFIGQIPHFGGNNIAAQQAHPHKAPHQDQG
ncbi:hypothetical protein V8J88_24145 [Massilia sp. W12]|uniref:hypothetical protein n=1 Tax=Massilia sp. W12 TaxID=3126507 RepID=UPI0030D428C6